MLRVFYEVAVEMLAPSSEDLIGAGGSASQRIHGYSAGCEQDTSVPATGRLPGLREHPAAWRLAASGGPSTGGGAGRKRQCLAWPSFGSHMPPLIPDSLR